MSPARGSARVAWEREGGEGLGRGAEDARGELCAAARTVIEVEGAADGAELVASKATHEVGQRRQRREERVDLRFAGRRGANGDVHHVAVDGANLDAVAHLDGPLEEDDDARDEVVGDGLQAEADAHGERAGDDRERRQVDAHGLKHHEQPDGDEEVPGDGADGVAYARVEGGARQHPLHEGALEVPRADEHRAHQHEQEQQHLHRHLPRPELEQLKPQHRPEHDDRLVHRPQPSAFR
jgi:hypothetical protein